MAILDFAASIDRMSKHLVTIAPETESSQSWNLPAHPFLQGFYRNHQPALATVGVNGKYAWDYSADPEKPALGDVFGFRFSRYSTSATANGQVIAKQWIVQFVDGAGVTLGGIRNPDTTATQSLIGTNLDIVAIGDSEHVVGLGTGVLTSYSGFADYAVTCEVTATTVEIALYAGSNTDSLAGNPMTVVATASMAHDGTLGPVEVLRMNPIRKNTTADYSSGFYGSDNAAWVGCVVAVGVDFARLFYANTPTLTQDGGSLTALSSLSTPRSLPAAFTGYYEAARDKRRTLKMIAGPGTSLALTGFALLKARLNISYGLSPSAKAFLAGSTQIEMFLHYSGTNYMLEKFGRDSGARFLEIESNPATSSPYAAVSDFQIGFVFREEI